MRRGAAARGAAAGALREPGRPGARPRGAGRCRRRDRRGRRGALGRPSRAAGRPRAVALPADGGARAGPQPDRPECDVSGRPLGARLAVRRRGAGRGRADPARAPGDRTVRGAMIGSEDTRDLIDTCVHCGFCLPACPTYQLWGEEMDSPRGRIHLMSLLEEGEIEMEAASPHIDRCLGCLACVTACPSGVRYDTLVERTRVVVEEQHPRPWPERALRGLVFGLFPFPRRLAVLKEPLRLYQRLGSPLLDRLPGRLSTLASLAPPVRRAVPLPALVPALGPRRAVVGMLTGCVQRAF